MALTPDEQKFYDFAKAALPKFLFQRDRPEEEMGALAKMFSAVRDQIKSWFTQSYITTATGAGPDFLNQHAVDRATRRQSGESDISLRERLRNVPDAVTRPTLLSAVADILDAESIVYDPAVYPAMVELNRDAGYYRDATSDSGTGGTFSGTAPNMVFTPTVDFDRPPFRSVEELITHKLVISGAATAANDGTRTITGLAIDGAQVANASGVAEVDATVSWTVAKYDRDDNLLDGFKDSFYSRGDRYGLASGRPELVVILPFGCTAGIQASVLEMLRKKKGAGVIARVECRLIP